MNEKDIIVAAMKERDYTQAKLAEVAGFRRQSNISELLRGKSIRVDNFVKLLNAMNYEVIVTDGNKKWIVGNDNAPTTPSAPSIDTIPKPVKGKIPLVKTSKNP